jgi:hypothetical protein
MVGKFTGAMQHFRTVRGGAAGWPGSALQSRTVGRLGALGPGRWRLPSRFRRGSLRETWVPGGGDLVVANLEIVMVDLPKRLTMPCNERVNFGRCIETDRSKLIRSALT